ncbi:Alpha-latroinsectotoxin-Lt1a [Lasiodiplodia hormozganensis]|uniref:Alpha-latroinsectotoxin-Lt1a n=1 Tax=Lasiodiplodia hormozganensis TaxID=869390 RepID=A0AA39U0H9_9PEZI|nr:Alpha-latroinsectotoxin-Lt1a [Lasiodiplodia hormozganensis]
MHLNQKCGSYGCALSSACFWSSEGVIAWLLKHGARVRTKDHAGRRPIHFAAYRNTSIFSQICEAGGDVAARDKVGRSVLHIAVQSGSAALVKRILEKDPSLLHARDKDNWAPLHYAVRGCPHSARWVREPIDSQTEIVKLLLDDEFTEEDDYMEDYESTDEDEPMEEDGEDDDESMEEDVEYDEDHSMEDDSDTDDSDPEDEL